MPAGYAAVPNPRDVPDDRELEDAFESDNEEDENTPLNHNAHQDDSNDLTTFTSASNPPGAYDFERDYDMPPPGSPPGWSSRALPNDFGNSNGRIPSSPVTVTPVRPQLGRRSFLRRIMGSVLPTHYATDTRVQIQENDGVFANVSAKPTGGRRLQTETGETYMVPEEIQSQAPPSYADAQADAVPPYWETNAVHAPATSSRDDMIIDDLPSGSFAVFCVNVFISFFFQFVGFLLTYLLHTSHAAKYGSRVGLGLTLIQFGFYSRALGEEIDEENAALARNGTQTDDGAVTPIDPSEVEVIGSVTARDWLAFVFMTIGWFLLLSSIVGFWRVKRWEGHIRSTTRQTPITREEIENDIRTRRNLESVFGISFGADDRQSSLDASRLQDNIRADESGHVIVIPAAELLEEARLARDLRAAGLL